MNGDSQIVLNALKEQRPGLLRFLVRRLGCESLAMDVLQGLSERLLTEPVASEVRNPRAYLYRAAANAAHSHSRAAKTRADYEAAAVEMRDASDMCDPERVLLGRAALATVEDALDELPVLTKRMFILFRVRGESQNAIAKRFGVSLSTVEKRIAKAAAHCHRKLEEGGFTGFAREARRKDGLGKDGRR